MELLNSVKMILKLKTNKDWMTAIGRKQTLLRTIEIQLVRWIEAQLFFEERVYF